MNLPTAIDKSHTEDSHIRINNLDNAFNDLDLKKIIFALNLNKKLWDVVIDNKNWKTKTKCPTRFTIHSSNEKDNEQEMTKDICLITITCTL